MNKLSRSTYYQRVMPVAGILYVIIMFLTGWNGTAVVVGALVLGLIAVIGNWIPADGPSD